MFLLFDGKRINFLSVIYWSSFLQKYFFIPNLFLKMKFLVLLFIFVRKYFCRILHPRNRLNCLQIKCGPTKIHFEIFIRPYLSSKVFIIGNRLADLMPWSWDTTRASGYFYRSTLYTTFPHPEIISVEAVPLFLLFKCVRYSSILYKLNFLSVLYCQFFSKPLLLSKHITAEVWMQFHSFRVWSLNATNQIWPV